jgi:hypothetical protein
MAAGALVCDDQGRLVLIGLVCRDTWAWPTGR